jgi:hypothetical protein
VGRSGRVIARFDHRTQHSGNISWLVETRSGAFFVRQLEFPMLRLLARTPMTETRGRDRFSVRGCLDIGQQCLIDSTQSDSGVPI